MSKVEGFWKNLAAVIYPQWSYVGAVGVIICTSAAQAADGHHCHLCASMRGG